MPREGLNLEKNEVREIIYKEVEKYDIPITEKEKELVEKIVASCPSAPNTTHLLIWCNKKVSEELEKYPDMNEDIEEIRNNIGKELRYKLDQKRFEELSDRIKIEKPEKISPQWIRDRFYGLSLSIRRGYKKLNGGVDWDFIVNKLNIKDKFEIKEKENWNKDKEKIINSLNNFLEEKNPIVFNPDWIYRYNFKISHQLLVNFRTEDNKVDWETISSFFDEKFKKRWSVSRQNTPILDLAENVIRIYEKEKPKKISPSWIIKHLPNDYAIIRRRFSKKSNREIDWQFFLDLLPIEITKIWTRKESTKEVIPENFYSDPDETDNIINKHRDKIYTFYTLLDKENDRKSREEIIKDLSLIIKKGNINALERLIEHLAFTVGGWVENDSKLQTLKYATNKVEEVIKKCLYRYDQTKGKFSTYLYVSLIKTALTVRKEVKGIGLKKHFSDGKAEYHETEEQDIDF